MWRSAFLLLLALSACDTPPAELDGDGKEPAAPVDVDDKPSCRTVASVRTAGGSRVEFCVDEAGGDLLSEHALIGDRSALADVAAGTCGLETFLALTDASTPVPRALVDSCAAQGRQVGFTRRIVDAPVLLAAAEGDEKPRAAPDYCGANGDDQFIVDVCNFINYQCHFGSDVECSAYCRPVPRGWHQQSSSTHLGQVPFLARERIASCDGMTRARVWFWKDGAWKIALDQPIQDGFVWNQHYSGENRHVRFRGDSEPGAWHFYAGQMWAPND